MANSKEGHGTSNNTELKPLCSSNVNDETDEEKHTNNEPTNGQLGSAERLQSAQSFYDKRSTARVLNIADDLVRIGTFDDFQSEASKYLLINSKLEQTDDDVVKQCAFEDWLFLALLMVFGIVLSLFVYGGSSMNDVLAELLGESLFTSGMVPLLTVAYKLGIARYHNASTMNDFKTDNIKKICMSLGFTIIGGIMVNVFSDLSDFGKMIGSTLLITGLIDLIQRLMFFQEDTELKAQRITNELAECKRTLSVGLATSYFYNFVKPFCDDLYENEDHRGKGRRDEEIRIEMVFGRGDNAETWMLCGSKFVYILIPRDLDVADLKTTYHSQLKVGHFKKYRTPFPYRFPVLEHWLSEAGQTHFCSGVCDVPTILTALYHRKKTLEILRRSGHVEVAEFNVQHEIMTFCNTLRDLIHEEPNCVKLVRIVSIPPVRSDGEIEWEDVKGAVAKIEGDPAFQ